MRCDWRDETGWDECDEEYHDDGDDDEDDRGS